MCSMKYHNAHFHFIHTHWRIWCAHFTFDMILMLHITLWDHLMPKTPRCTQWDDMTARYVTSFILCLIFLDQMKVEWPQIWICDRLTCIFSYSQHCSGWFFSMIPMNEVPQLTMCRNRIFAWTECLSVVWRYMRHFYGTTLPFYTFQNFDTLTSWFCLVVGP